MTIADEGYIKPITAERTKRMGLGVKRNRFYTSRREGYFFDFVKQELIDRYGIDTVRRGGLRIDTTLDLRMQRLARKTICFSKAILMHDIVLGLFVNRYEFGLSV